MYAFDDTALELVAILAGKDFNTDDAAAFPTLHAQRGVFHVLCLLTEDRVEKPLLRSKLCLTFGRHFPDQNIAGAHLRTDAYHPVLVEVAELEFRHVGDVMGRHFAPELRVADDADELFHMYRGEADRKST